MALVGKFKDEATGMTLPNAYVNVLILRHKKEGSSHFFKAAMNVYMNEDSYRSGLEPFKSINVLAETNGASIIGTIYAEAKNLAEFKDFSDA